jgi:hypothetical protein
MEYSQVSTKNIRNTSESTDIEALYKTSKTNPYRKTTYTQKCTKKSVCYTKYGLIFSGIITLILMVVFGINNVASDFENNNTTETSVLNTTETSRVNESSSVHPRPKDVLDDDDKEIQFSTPKVEIESPQTESDDEEGVKVTTDIENLINSKGLAFRSHGTERVNGGGEDIVIANKTVIINGGNDSIIITN